MNDLAQIVVGYAEGGELPYGGMLSEHRLDLAGVDIEAAGEDQIGAAAQESVEALFISCGEVAGAHPPILEGGCGGLGAFVVAGEDARTAEPDLACVIESGLDVWEGQSDRSGHTRPLVGIGEHDTDLGHPIALEDLVSKAVAEAAPGPCRQGCRPAGEQAHGVQLSGLHWRLNHAVVEGRHAHEHRAAVGVDRAPGGLDREGG